MSILRAFLFRNRRLAALLVVAALCMKALIPAGYMLGGESRTLVVKVCADSTGQVVTKQIGLSDSGQSSDHGKGKSAAPCHFSAHGHAVLGGVDPIQLALALLFILALAFAPLLPASVVTNFHVRPPLRGPPAQV